jgi:hypothetical protein
MKLDTDQEWCKIHPSGEDLKKEMLEVAKHTITTRLPNKAWAEDLVFIAPFETETTEIQDRKEIHQKLRTPSLPQAHQTQAPSSL